MRGGEYPGAGRYLPDGTAGLAELARAARDCHGCDLYERATQVVFGSGDEHAAVMLVGEQPGDAEDRQGRPFVGPAGRILDQAVAQAGLPAESTYVTNAVKHFRWRIVPGGGKRRIHQKPDTWQVRACGPWLRAEVERVDPRVIVTLGATAGLALFGSGFRVGDRRGQAIEWSPAGGQAGLARLVVPTIHPSAVLRAEDRDAMYDGLVRDLAVAASAL